MIDQLNVLIELQEIDAAIRSRREQVSQFPGRRESLEQQSVQNKEGLDKVREALQEAQKNKRDRDRDLEAGAQKVEKLKARTSEIKTNKEYQAMLKEIETAEQENKAIEDGILVLMEKIDSATAQIAAAETQVKEREAAIQIEKKQLDEAQAALEQQLKAQEEERRKIAARIKEELLDQYQKLLNAKGGRAVVEAWDESCSGCRMRIQPQLFVNIKKNEEINTCPHCNRILYYKNAIMQKNT